MAYDEETAQRVRRILRKRRDVAEKRMVGGLSFLVNGALCCGVTSTGLMVRVGQGSIEQALAEPHVRPMEFAGRRLRAFVQIDPEGYRTDPALASWIQRAVDVVSTLPSKKPGTRSRGTSAPGG
jgi:TfoX/Sxy family transcriptional regulator of competence genes